MNGTKVLLRRMIRSTGFDVVRVARTLRPTERPADGAPAARPGHEQTFFPALEDPAPFRPWPVPPDLAGRSEEWAKVLAELYTRPASWPACVSPETGMFIHMLVRNLRPRVVIETGTCHGASTIWIAAAMRMVAESQGRGKDAGELHTFDDFRNPTNESLVNMPLYMNREAKVRQRFTRCGFNDLIRVHIGDSASSVEALRPDLDRSGGVQLAFIDGDHTPEGAKRDLMAVEPSLNIGGYVLLHDVFPSECNWTGPRWLVDHIEAVAAGKYQFCDIYTAPLNYGVTLLRRVG